MNRKFDAGPALVALGAIALLVALFLSWFDPGGTAWEAFELVDLALASIAVAALAAVAGWLGDDGSRPAAGLALAALVIVAVQLIEPPPLLQQSDVEPGGWLALAAAAAMLVGAVLTLASISVTVDVRGREGRRRVAAVDRRAESDEEQEVAKPAAEPATEEPGQRTQPFSALAPDDAEEEER